MLIWRMRDLLENVELIRLRLIRIYRKLKHDIHHNIQIFMKSLFNQRNFFKGFFLDMV